MWLADRTFRCAPNAQFPDHLAGDPAAELGREQTRQPPETGPVSPMVARRDRWRTTTQA